MIDIKQHKWSDKDMTLNHPNTSSNVIAFDVEGEIMFFCADDVIAMAEHFGLEADDWGDKS